MATNRAASSPDRALTSVSLSPVLSPRLNVARWARRYGAGVSLLLLLCFNLAFTPHFVSWQTLNVNLTQVATIVIVGVGMTLVIATGGIDLSVGALMAISGALAPIIFLSEFGAAHPALGVVLAFAAPVLVTGLFGFFNGWFITRFRVQPIVGTLVLFIAGRGIGQVMTNGNLQVFKAPAFQFIGLGRIFDVPFQVLLMAALVVAAGWMLRRTLFGRYILAVGGNEAAARLGGVPVDRVKRRVYAISGICAGVAGLIVVAINSSSDANLVGLGMELDVIAAVAVGGTLLTGGQANVAGTLIGALIIQLLRYTLLANGVSDAAALLVKGAIIAAAVWLQRRGQDAAPPPTIVAERGGRAVLAVLDRNRAVVALALLILFGALRYDHFLGPYNVVSVLRYNSMFALTGLGMCFVIITGGIDLSVGAVAALASVVSAILSPYGLVPGLVGGLGAGFVVGAFNGALVARLKILPFIATLSGMLVASGSALLAAHNQTVGVSYENAFTAIGQGDLLGLPIPMWIAGCAYALGSLLLNYLPFGRYALAIGGEPDAARLMGLPVGRVVFFTYVQSGLLAGLAGVILAAQFGAGQPTEGVGWELFSIAAVVVGGTLLSGGRGSVGATLAGVLLLGLVFNILNFENGIGWISLSAYWQSVIRGAFLFIVVVAGSGGGRRLKRRAESGTKA
jgi:ribose/xylose/arabinose/galactoside ABC-type transport system permease subunit